MRRAQGMTVLALAALLAAGIALAPAARAEQWAGGDLTLDRAIAWALERNLGYATANLSAEAAASATREAGDKLQPKVTVGGSYDRHLADAGDGTQATVSATQSYPGLAPVVTLPGHPRPLAPVAFARLSEDQARHKADKARSDLVYNVTQAYFNVLKAARLKEVQRAALASAEAARKDAQAKVAGGTATRVDFLKAEMEVADAELNVTKADNADTNAESALFTLLGVEPPAKPIGYAPAPETVEPDGTLATLIAQALDHRPDLAESRLSVERAVSQQNQADLATLPTLSLSGSYTGDKHSLSSSWEPLTGTLSWTATGSNASMVAAGTLHGSSSTDEWNAGVSVSYPLYDAGALREAALQARLEVAQAKNTLEQTRNSVVSEIQSAWLELAEAKLSVEAARKAVGQSAEALRLTRLRVENGVGTPSELLDANAQDLQIQVNLVQAESARQLAVVKLKKAAGLL